MSLSVSNNPSALLALQNLNRTTDQLTQVQEQISTGHAVDKPQDNPTVWAMAQGQSSQIDGLNAVTSSLNRATSISDVALNAGQTVLNLLEELKTKSLSAQDPQLSTGDRSALNTDFAGVLKQITDTLSSANFDGSNLLDGSQATNMRFLATADGSQTVTLPATNLSLGDDDPDRRLDQQCHLGDDRHRRPGQVDHLPRPTRRQSERRPAERGQRPDRQ